MTESEQEARRKSAVAAHIVSAAEQADGKHTVHIPSSSSSSSAAAAAAAASIGAGAAGVPPTDLAYGVGETQGIRPSMEDAHTAIVSLAMAPQVSFFGVYDGHGGDETSHFLSFKLHKYVCKQNAFPDDLKTALEQGFLVADAKMCDKATIEELESGATTLVALVTPTHVVVANAGDCRCVLARRDGSVVNLSHDHKCTDPHEQERVFAAGMTIEDGRVDGRLMVARAIGDVEFKQNFSLPPEKQAVTAFPEVITERRRGDEHFLLLACDGVWDVFTSEEACAYVHSLMPDGAAVDPTEIALRLAAKAIERGSTDNVTALLVTFNLPTCERLEARQEARDLATQATKAVLSKMREAEAQFVMMALARSFRRSAGQGFPFWSQPPLSADDDESTQQTDEPTIISSPTAAESGSPATSSDSVNVISSPLVLGSPRDGSDDAADAIGADASPTGSVNVLSSPPSERALDTGDGASAAAPLAAAAASLAASAAARTDDAAGTGVRKFVARRVEWKRGGGGAAAAAASSTDSQPADTSANLSAAKTAATPK